LNNDIISGINRYKFLYLLLLPAVVYVFIFRYLPIYGLASAFLDYNYVQGISGSTWVGFQHFQRLFGSSMFMDALKNTLIISSYKIISGLFCPVILAIMLSEIKQKWYQRTLQTVIYLPRFVSWVVYGGIVTLMLSPETGLINRIIEWMGFKPIYFLINPGYFRGLLVVTDILKEAGWGAIIYIAAIAGIDQQLYEAAIVDGASRLQRIFHITLPGISTTIAVMLIIRVGYLLSAGLDQVINLYNPMVLGVGDILDTYVYREGIEKLNISLATAAGLIQSVVGFALVLTANKISKKINGSRAIM